MDIQKENRDNSLPEVYASILYQNGSFWQKNPLGIHRARITVVGYMDPEIGNRYCRDKKFVTCLLPYLDFYLYDVTTTN
jgi:hypothetical protein